MTIWASAPCLVLRFTFRYRANRSSVAGLANAMEDIVAYAAKALVDPRTENKRVVVCPAANKATQNDLIALWERISGKKVSKSYMSAEELDQQIKGGLHFILLLLLQPLLSIELGLAAEQGIHTVPCLSHLQASSNCAVFICMNCSTQGSLQQRQQISFTLVMRCQNGSVTT